MVVQPTTRLGFADDDEFPVRDQSLPSRREQREHERRENGDLLQADLETESYSVHDELSAQPLLAMTLRELEPPSGDTVGEAASGPRSASSHANAVPATSTLSALADAETEAEVEAPVRALKQTGAYTGAVWIIAAMPLVQLLASVLLIMVVGQGNNLPLMLVVWIAPYLAVLGFAAYDKLVLQTWGHKRPASAWWALASQPGYLAARAVSTYRETGKGFAPIALWAAAIVAVLAGTVALPGLAISLLPDTFSTEIEQSVRADAAALGADLTVECPSSPPILIGQTFTCTATKASGVTDSILVSLQRQNGWITWRVEDWGNWVLAD